MVVHRPDHLVVSKVRDDDVAFVRDLLYRVCGNDPPFSSLLDKFVHLGLGTIPNEYGDGSRNVFFAPLREVASHRIAHRSETDKAYLDDMVARSTRTGERVGLCMLVLNVEKVGILGSVHGGRANRREDETRRGI